MELGFEPDAQFREIDQPPAGEGPERFLAIVLDADEQVHGVVGDLEGFDFRFEVEAAEGAFG